MSRRSGISLLLVIMSGLVIACQSVAPTAVQGNSAGQAQPATSHPVPPETPQAEQQHQAAVCISSEDMVPFAFTPEGSGLLVRTGMGVQVIDLLAGEQGVSIETSQGVVAASLSPDGRILAWSLPDGRIQLIRLPDQELLADFPGHPDPVLDLQFSAAGDRLFSASHDGVIRVWDMHGQLLDSIEIGVEVVGFGISPDGSMLAAIPSDGPVQVWDVVQRGRIAELGGTGGYDTSGAHFSPNGRFLAADLATALFLWRVEDSALLWNDVKNSMAVAFSPDGEYLAYSDINAGNRIFLAAPDASQLLRTLDPFQGPVWEMFFSSDGSLLAATDGIEIRIMRVADGTLRYLVKPECP